MVCSLKIKTVTTEVVIDPAGDVSFYNETDDSTPKFRWDASTERLGYRYC